MSRSTSDLNAVNVEIESVASSPGTTRVSFLSFFFDYSNKKVSRHTKVWTRCRV